MLGGRFNSTHSPPCCLRALQGKARAAYDLVITGRLKVAPPPPGSPEGSAASSAPVASDDAATALGGASGRIPFEERAPDEEVLDVADGGCGAY